MAPRARRPAEIRGSSYRIRSGLAFASASAACAVLANSRSTMKTFASAWSSMKAIDSRIEPRVERVEHRARHGDAVMGFEHRRRVGEQHGDGVAAPDPLIRQRRGKPARPRVELGIGDAALAVDDGDDDRDARRRCGRGSSAASAAGNWPASGRGRCRRPSTMPLCRRARPAPGAAGAPPARRRNPRRTRATAWGREAPFGRVSTRAACPMRRRVCASPSRPCEALSPWPFSAPWRRVKRVALVFAVRDFCRAMPQITVEKAARNLEHVHRRWKASGHDRVPSGRFDLMNRTG